MKKAIAATVLAAGAALGGSGLYHQHESPPRSTPTQCTTPPVFHPDRLETLDPCATFSGTALAVIHERYDGDYHIWAAPDGLTPAGRPGYEQLLNSKNVYRGQPAMVLEISPDCQQEPERAQAATHCPPSSVHPPRAGQHFTATGPWVLDTHHGWNEIHPVASLSISSPNPSTSSRK